MVSADRYRVAPLGICLLSLLLLGATSAIRANFRVVTGTLTFTFIDCDHGTMDFNSVLGYGTGKMNLTRSTQPAGLTCP